MFLTARDLEGLTPSSGTSWFRRTSSVFARAIWLLILCGLVWLLTYAVTGPLFAYPWST